jgi:hypothetical protein
VLEYLLRHHPNDVYETIDNLPGGPTAILEDMLAFVGYPPIADTIVKLYVSIVVHMRVM